MMMMMMINAETYGLRYHSCPRFNLLVKYSRFLRLYARAE